MRDPLPFVALLDDGPHFNVNTVTRMRERDIFIAALETDDPLERARVLDQACAGNASLRAKIEELLAKHERQADFILDAPPAALDATLDVEVPERPGATIGPYKLLQQLGDGGMGVVFMAEQSSPLHRIVALKIIKPGMDSGQVIARFEAERQALAMMDHPNIAKVLDAGTTNNGRPYFVMELVKGVPITKYCDEKHLSVAERLQLMVPVCQAVQHAHQKGIIHRDLKPSNVLVAEYDFQPIPKVIDFGVAKATASKLTERTMFTGYGQVVGTIEYMSPEQAKLNQLDIDTRSDIYSLGVLLYELLAGSTPFERQRLREAAFDEVLRIIREEEPPKPSTRLSTAAESASIAANRGLEPRKLSGQLKGELDWVVMKSLEKDRNRRYETANGLALDLQRFLAGEPVLAHPPSTRYRLTKFVRKHRAAMIVATTLLLALVGGVLGTTRGMVRAGRAERRAILQRDYAVHARKEVFEMLTDLTDSTVGKLLAQNPATDPAQRMFLERVVARYERLAAGVADAAGAETMRADCLNQVGKTYVLLGDNERAVESLLQAIAEYRTRLARSPGDPESALHLMESLNLAGIAYERLEQFANRDQTLEESLAIAIDAHRKFPDHVKITRSLAIFYSNRAVRRWSDPVARLDDIDHSIDVAQTLADQNPADPQFRRDLAVGFARRARHFAALNDVPATRAALEKVEALMLGVGLDGDLLLADSYMALGGALTRTGQGEAAIAAYRIAAQLAEEMAAHSPGDAHVTANLEECLSDLERLLRNAGRTDQADVCLGRARALAERRVDRSGGDRASLGSFIDLTAATARSHWGAGRHSDGAAAVEKLVAAGRRMLAAQPNPTQTNGKLDRADARRQAHRFRQIADLSNQLQRYEDAIDFAKKQFEFARAASDPDERPNEELFVLLESANWSVLVALDATGRLNEALPYWDELMRITAWTSPIAIREDACRYLAELAGKLEAQGSAADPVAVLAPGIAERRTRLAANPDDDAARTELRRGYRALGAVLEYSHHFAEAAEANRQGIALSSPESGKPNNWTQPDRDVHSLLLLGQAVCLDALGNEAEADAAWTASQEFSGNKYDSWTFEIRAVNMARNSEWKWAVRLAEALLVDAPQGGRTQYNAACAFALASAAPSLPPDRKEDFARRAVALISDSKKAGWFDDPAQAAIAKVDDDLKAIRGRADFAKQFPELTSAPVEANSN